MNQWLWLFMAIILEVIGTSCLKLSYGMSKLIPSILTFIFYGFSFTCLSISLKTLEVGIAYSIWSGLGTALIAAIGIYYFEESISLVKILSIVLIIIGVIGLNLSIAKAH